MFHGAPVQRRCSDGCEATGAAFSATRIYSSRYKNWCAFQVSSSLVSIFSWYGRMYSPISFHRLSDRWILSTRDIAVELGQRSLVLILWYPQNGIAKTMRPPRLVRGNVEYYWQTIIANGQWFSIPQIWFPLSFRSRYCTRFCRGFLLVIPVSIFSRRGNGNILTYLVNENSFCVWIMVKLFPKCFKMSQNIPGNVTECFDNECLR